MVLWIYVRPSPCGNRPISGPPHAHRPSRICLSPEYPSTNYLPDNTPSPHSHQKTSIATSKISCIWWRPTQDNMVLVGTFVSVQRTVSRNIIRVRAARTCSCSCRKAGDPSWKYLAGAVYAAPEQQTYGVMAKHLDKTMIDSLISGIEPTWLFRRVCCSLLMTALGGN